MQLFSQTALVGLFAMACRFRNKIRVTERKPLSPQRSQQRDEADIAEEGEDGNAAADGVLTRAKDTLMRLLRGLVTFTLRYIVWATVFVVYVAALEDVTLINAFYLIVLIAFMGFPSLRERYWVSLVVYCVAVLLLLYLWGFSIHGRHDTVETLLGLDAGIHKHMWRSMRWHLAILLLSGTQLLLFRWTQSASTLKANGRAGRRPSRMARESSYEDPNAEPLLSHARHADVSAPSAAAAEAPPSASQEGGEGEEDDAALPKSLAASLEALVYAAWPTVVAVAVACAGLLGEVNLLRLGYLALFGVQLLLRVLNLPRAATRWELVIMLYAAMVLITKYMYQFRSLQRRVDDDIDEAWLEDVGLRVMTTQLRLFVYLVCQSRLPFLFRGLVSLFVQSFCLSSPNVFFFRFPVAAGLTLVPAPSCRRRWCWWPLSFTRAFAALRTPRWKLPRSCSCRSGCGARGSCSSVLARCTVAN